MKLDRLTTDRFSEDELKWSYWFVTHRIILQKIFFIFLIAINVVLGVLFIYLLIDMYVLKGSAYSNGLNTLVTTTGNIGNLQPEGDADISEIQILDSQALLGQDSRFDVFALLGNSNTRHFSTFEYRFVGQQDTTPWKKSFLLPNESRYIHELFFKATGDMTSPSIEFRKVKWDKFLEYDKFAETHLRLTIDDPTFVSSSANEAGEESGNKVSFKVNNESAYSYRNLGLFVVLYLGQQVQAVNHIVLDGVEANKEYDVELPFYDSVSSATTIEVLPEVNILDPAVYKKL